MSRRPFKETVGLVRGVVELLPFGMIRYEKLTCEIHGAAGDKYLSASTIAKALAVLVKEGALSRTSVGAYMKSPAPIPLEPSSKAGLEQRVVDLEKRMKAIEDWQRGRLPLDPTG